MAFGISILRYAFCLVGWCKEGCLRALSLACGASALISCGEVRIVVVQRIQLNWPVRLWFTLRGQGRGVAGEVDWARRPVSEGGS